MTKIKQAIQTSNIEINKTYKFSYNLGKYNNINFLIFINIIQKDSKYEVTYKHYSFNNDIMINQGIRTDSFSYNTNWEMSLADDEEVEKLNKYIDNSIFL